MKDWLTRIAVILPLLGLSVLIARAEFGAHFGPSWQISINGYGPRDGLHGRFLTYQYAFEWQGPHSCGSSPQPNPPLDPKCCLCLTRTDRDGINPLVRQVECHEAEACDGMLAASSVQGSQRYFVPEDRARELEGALRERNASLKLTCGPNGRPAIHDLYLDGQPWREVLGD